MNGLYPIIRRVRRPLVPLVDGTAGGADAKPTGEKAESGKQKAEICQPGRGEGSERKDKHGEAATTESAY